MALLLVLSVAHAGVCLGLLRQSLNRLRRGSGFSPLLVLAVALLGAAGVAVSVVAFPGPGQGKLSLEAGAAMLTFGAAVAGACTPLLPVRVLPALVVVPAIGLFLVQAAVDDVHHSLWAVYFVIVASSAIVTYASSVWFLGVLWELADSRDTQSRLAVAEERLRFSRDLHDVLGRNLALMAVNSELAARAGPPPRLGSRRAHAGRSAGRAGLRTRAA